MKSEFEVNFLGGANFKDMKKLEAKKFNDPVDIGILVNLIAKELSINIRFIQLCDN